MGRFKHVDDVERKDDGTLVYTGGFYRIAGDAAEMKRTLISFVAGTLLLVALVVLSGCIDSKNAISSFTVIIPLIAEVCCLFVICWQAAKVAAGRGRVRTYVLESMTEKIPVACKMLVVVALTGMVFSLVYLFRHGADGQLLKSIVYPVLKLLIASTAVGYEKFFMTIRWVKA
jgi:hypothetical protein